jgi:Do/DeqQ family serine protease
MKLQTVRYSILMTILVLALAVAACRPAQKEKPTPNTPAKPAVAATNAPPAQQSATLGFSDVAESAVKGVVNISSTKVVTAPAGNSPMMQDPFFRRFFGPQFRDRAPEQRRERSRGSGVIISTDGYVLTNNHVVEGADEVAAVLLDGREVTAVIVGTDPKSDVAVLKIEADGLEPVVLGKSADLRLGEVVLAIGNPFGLGHTVTQGIVSALGRARVGIADYEDFIQTDAAINPGNSGGALVNTRGELVGINTAIASSSGGYQGIGFAIPIDMARSIMDSLRQYGRVERGYLGVMIQDVAANMAEQFGLDRPTGALIADVLKGGPADDGGLRRGDVVLSVDGFEVADASHFRNTISQNRPEAVVALVLLRDKEKVRVSMTVGKNPEDEGALAATPEKGAEENQPKTIAAAGLTVTDATPRALRHFGASADLVGVIIIEVDRSSTAAEAGLKPGDVILEVNRTAVTTAGQFHQVIEATQSDSALLLVNREGVTTFVALDLD